MTDLEKLKAVLDAYNAALGAARDAYYAALSAQDKVPTDENA